MSKKQASSGVWNNAFWIGNPNQTIICCLILNKSCIYHIFALCKKYEISNDKTDDLVEHINWALNYYKGYHTNLETMPNRSHRLKVQSSIVQTAQNFINALYDIDQATYSRVSLAMQEKFLDGGADSDIQSLQSIIDQTERSVSYLQDIFIHSQSSIKADSQRNSSETEARRGFVDVLARIFTDYSIPLSSTRLCAECNTGEGEFHKTVRLCLASIDRSYIGAREIGEVKGVKKRIGI